MNKISIMLFLIMVFFGCRHPLHPSQPPPFEKINARILVSVPETFSRFQSDHPYVIKTLSFKFSKPVATLLPKFFNDTFQQATVAGSTVVPDNKIDFLVIPKFEKVLFDSDRNFGHELRVTVSMTFTDDNNSSPIVVKGTGLARDMFGEKRVYEQEMAESALADALADLRNKIHNRRSEFEKTGQ